jgi:hypothetical protein
VPAYPKKYDDWFDLGADRFRRWAAVKGLAEQLPDEAVYLCPLCTRLLCTKEELGTGLLSGEHVPPKDVGGGKILLTCKPCNNGQGGRIDGHARGREWFVDLITGTHTLPRKKDQFPTVDGEHHAGPFTGRGNLWLGPGGIGFEYDNNPKRNDKAKFAAYEQNARETTSWRLTANLGYKENLADLSYIRAAYLASFAVFGWTHILRPTYDLLRQRLAEASMTDLEKVAYQYDAEDGSGGRAMFLVDHPDSPVHGLVVIKISRVSVVLPGPEDPRSLPGAAAALYALREQGDHTLDGYPIPWPTKPEHRWDPKPDPLAA